MKIKLHYPLIIMFFLLPGMLKAQSVHFDWIYQIGGDSAAIQSTQENNTYSRETIVDRKGYVYSVGHFSGGDIEFGTRSIDHQLNIKDGQQIVSKFNTDGSLVWVKQFGIKNNPDYKKLGSSVYTSSIAVDSSGNLYIGGIFKDSFDFDPGPNIDIALPLQKTESLFIIKLDANGNFIWKYTALIEVPKAAEMTIISMAADEAGGVYACGQIAGTVDFDPKSGNGANILTTNFPAAYILKLNGTSGNPEWVKGIGRGFGTENSATVAMTDIATDKNGNVIVTGSFNGYKVDFDPGSQNKDTFFMQSPGTLSVYPPPYDTMFPPGWSWISNDNVFILKLNSTGDFKWAKQMGGMWQDQGFSIATDDEGSIYTTGWFGDTADFDPGAQTYNLISKGTGAAKTGVFISKLNADGDFAWAKQLHGPGDNVSSITVGNGQATGVYITGTYSSETSFYSNADTFTLDWTSYAINGGSYIIKLDTAGNGEWAKAITTPAWGSIAVDDTGNVFVSGTIGTFLSGIYEDFDFDPGPDTFLVSARALYSSDRFILKLKWCNLIDTLIEQSCKAFVYRDVTYDSTGIYIIPNPEGCDSNSLTVIDFTRFHLNPIINVDGIELSTMETYTTYQWLLDGNVIPDAQKDVYTVTKNGNYQVIVTNESGCIDTSDIYEVNNIDESGIGNSTVAKGIKIYPNPAQDMIFVDAKIKVNLRITGIEGRLIREKANAEAISIADLAEGIYLMHIMDTNGTLLKTEKFIKAK